MTIHEAQQQLIFKLYDLYNDRESAAIANLIMERVTGWKKIDRVINKQVPLSIPQQELYESFSAELLLHKPVQYVLHEAWFAGMKFFVDENVLIPRPETEELVQWVTEDVLGKKSLGNGEKPNGEPGSVSILDIGTGSGCIPIALKKQLPDAQIYSCDISKEALAVARQNALANKVQITLIQSDILDKKNYAMLPMVDVIVSNPPYIPLKDKAGMQRNVTGYEPHLALFVENEHPLIFYDAISEFAKQKLNQSGRLFVEIHEDLGTGIVKLFSEKGFQQIETRKDLQGKERMIKATMLL